MFAKANSLMTFAIVYTGRQLHACIWMVAHFQAGKIQNYRANSRRQFKVIQCKVMNITTDPCLFIPVAIPL